MSINVLWDDEDRTVLRWNFIGKWTIQDFYDVYDKLNTALTESPHKVNVLLDMTESSQIPNGFMSALRSVRSRPAHDNMGVMASIGNSMFVRTFVNTFSKIYPPRKTAYYMVGSYEEAYALFAEQIP